MAKPAGRSTPLAAGGNTADPSELLYRGQNVLGKATEIATPGQVDQPLSAGIAATPAPAGTTTGPGGAVERGGGVLDGQAGGPGGGGGGGMSELELAMQALGIAGKSARFLSQLFGADNTRGNVGGEGQIQGSDQSLSDRIRSIVDGAAAFPTPGAGLAAEVAAGGAPPSDVFNPDFLGGAGGGAGALANYFSSPEGLAALGELGLNTDVLRGAAAVPGAAGAGSGVASGLGTGATGAAAVAAVLGLIVQQTGNADLAKAAQSLGAAGSLAGTGAALGSLGATTGATGAAGTATLGTAGSAVAGAMAPIALTYLAMSINDMIQGPKDAQQLGARVQQHARDLPIVAEQLRSVPGLLSQVQQASPEQAAKLFDQLEGIRNFYRESGTENLLKHGQSGISGHTMMGDEMPSWNYPQYKETHAEFAPLLQALDYAQLVAQDKASRAGLSVGSPRSASDWAQLLGSRSYFPTSQPIAQSDTAARQAAADEEFRAQARASQQEGQWAYGIPLEQINAMTAPPVADTGWMPAPQPTILPTQTTEYAPWLQAQLMGPTGTSQAAANEALRAQARASQQEGQWAYGIPLDQINAMIAPQVDAGWTTEAAQQLAAIQPGSYEEGLRQLFGAGLTPNRLFNEMRGIHTPGVAAPATAAPAPVALTAPAAAPAGTPGALGEQIDEIVRRAAQASR